ncbi:hypothetical protein I551_7304 [Mycobacterium ulcerans str. Harvey]|uniref:Uncharacterized protein n=1 Tax=Mycobacterium ulcerans str. Harvey TaxID=1299332 RepID=A0ABP3A435_MYCUL|nr:hypothetical protein I551_7304 [Mycobacterium ulcerans str. Harvey]
MPGGRSLEHHARLGRIRGYRAPICRDDAAQVIRRLGGCQGKAPSIGKNGMERRPAESTF